MGPPQTAEEERKLKCDPRKKEGPDLRPALKALGNGGVSSREDEGYTYPIQ